MCNIIKYKSPFGVITIREKDNKISRVYFPNSEPEITDISEYNSDLLCDLLIKAKTQMSEYFGGRRKNFDLPLTFDGCTDFMQSVYRELLKIPYGETASYKDIANKVGRPKGFRAVGLANAKNPLPIIIPCHRVIGSNGKLTGFGGGIELKIKLLELEKKFC